MRNRRAFPCAAALLLPAVAAVAAWPLGPFLTDRWLRWEGMWLDGLVLAAGLGWWVILGFRGDEAAADRRGSPGLGWVVAAAAAFAAYAGFHLQVPRLLGFGLAALGVACALVAVVPAGRRGAAWGLVPLLLLSLPVMPSVDFVFGYPLRAAVAKAASVWLGSGIRAVGVGLTDGVATVFVDAPCSGLKMLHVALLLASASALAVRLRVCSTVLLLAFGVGMALLANVWRAVALFQLELSLLDGVFSHAPVGLIVFGVPAAAIPVTGWFLRPKADRASAGRSEVEAPAAAGSTGSARPGGVTRGLVLGLFGVAAVWAAAAPLATVEIEAATTEPPSFAWPTRWEGVPLVPAPMPEGLRRFLGGFPGRMAEFRLGDTGRRVFLRWTPVPTRLMHTAEGCYRARGARVTPLPAERDARGHVWSRFRAVAPDGTESTVRQAYFAVAPGSGGARLEDLIGGARSWPDASAWYWAAARPGSRVAATLAVTVTE
jgi:exosortase/archaeosortase family protein